VIRRVGAGFATLVALAACSASEFGSVPSAAIALTVGSAEIDLPQGLAVLTVANVSRSGGFAGDVVFAVEGAPSGMRALAASPETLDGVTSVLVAVGTDPGFATGTYPLTVRASGGGVSDAVGSLTVIVRPAGTGVYALEVRPVSVAQGGQTVELVRINRADFLNIPVTISSEHVPAGVTITIYPVKNIKALSYMTVAAARTAEPGQYRITVRGFTPGLADRIETVPLTVLPAQP
jgi:hypothetical protein